MTATRSVSLYQPTTRGRTRTLAVATALRGPRFTIRNTNSRPDVRD